MTEILETRHATGIFDDAAFEEHFKKVALPHDEIWDAPPLTAKLCFCRE